MTREDSIRTRTWVTDDGRYLTVDQITDDHLGNIRRMLLTDITPGYDQARGREIARDWIARHDILLDYTELDRDAYISAWLQIVDEEFARRVEQLRAEVARARQMLGEACEALDETLTFYGHPMQDGSPLHARWTVWRDAALVVESPRKE